MPGADKSPYKYLSLSFKSSTYPCDDPVLAASCAAFMNAKLTSFRFLANELMSCRNDSIDGLAYTNGIPPKPTCVLCNSNNVADRAFV